VIKNFQSHIISEKGLNLHCIFNLSDLSKGFTQKLEKYCDGITQYRQLLLLGHAGKKMWQCIRRSELKSADHVDNYTIQSIQQFFAQLYPDCQFKIIYPLHQDIGLQKLGTLAGWHHPTPFRVGIHQDWGTWFAYRAVLLLDSDFAQTFITQSKSPCASCEDKVCIKNCPAAALASEELNLSKCIAYRQKKSSLCRTTCLSRVSCPIAPQHRYSEEQIHYHYSVSLKMIERM